MMGTPQPQKTLFAYRVDLDQRVAPDHLLRRVNEAVDFSFARQRVADRYGYNGNVSVGPAVILKLMFLLFFGNVPSERERMRMLPYRLDDLWFLGYGLDEEVPDHSVLSKARARWGTELFEELFVRVVGACVKAGLVEGNKVHVDGSLVDANASKSSVVKGAGERLSRRKQKTARKCFEYAASASTCSTCRLRPQCTRAKGTARTIQRHDGQEAIEAARAQSHSAQAQRDRARRQWLVEGSFADAANNHGFKRARWRRLWRQQIQDYLIATIQNVRILLRQASAPRAAAVASLLPLSASNPLSLCPRSPLADSADRSARIPEIIFSEN